MYETVILVLLLLMIVLFAGCLFVLILIWRAIMGRSVVSAKVGAQIAAFSAKIAQYTGELSKMEGSVRGLNQDVSLLSRDLQGLPANLRDELEKYAKTTGTKS